MRIITSANRIVIITPRGETHTHFNKYDLDNYSPSLYEPAGVMASHITEFNHNNIGKIKDVPVDDTNKANNRILVYKSISQSFVYEDKPSGGSGGGGLSGVLYDIGTKNTAFNINFSNGYYQKVRLSANIAMGILDPPEPLDIHTLVLFIQQDSVGNRQWTSVNNTNVDLGGMDPINILSLSPNFFDILTFIWFSGKWRLVNAIFERV